jgi:signal transduction histidine kinase
MRQPRVQVVNSVDSALLPRIAMCGDPVRVEQVLLNVLVNAIKFTPPSGRVEVSVELSDSLVRLTVTDTGIGISPEFLSCLFDRFSQADESLRKDPGVGLGLTISRHIVELHGGKISAISEGPGQRRLVHYPVTDCFRPIGEPAGSGFTSKLPSTIHPEQTLTEIGALGARGCCERNTSGSGLSYESCEN